jgi:dUTP pyrophosphatase
MEKLFFYKIDQNGPGLTKVNKLDVGYDLHSTETVALSPGSIYKIRTNVKIRVPNGTYGRIAERSSLASKGIRIGGGVIDPNYTGEIICLISSMTGYVINKNDKIAQLILERVCVCDIEELSSPPASVDDRGTGGLGSTGK